MSSVLIAVFGYGSVAALIIYANSQRKKRIQKIVDEIRAQPLKDMGNGVLVRDY